MKKENLEKTRKLINQSAAIKSDAQIIVTYNLKDFPYSLLKKFGVEAQHPDDFFLNQCDLNLPIFLTAVKNIRKSLKKPPKSPEEYLDSLRRSALVKTSKFLENFIKLL